jgi:hypothetical protein
MMNCTPVVRSDSQPIATPSSPETSTASGQTASA